MAHSRGVVSRDADKEVVAHQRLELVPVGILPSRNGLAHSWHPVTQANVACLSAGIAKLGEAAMLPGQDELGRTRGRVFGRHSSLK